MKLEILGTGGGNTPEYGNTSFLIWNKNSTEAILMDCGYTVYPYLKNLEAVSGREIISKIKTVAISHLHDDHVGSFGALLTHRWALQKSKIKIAGVSLDEYLRLVLSSHVRTGVAGIDKRVLSIPTSHEEDMPSYALYFNGVLYSGDTNKSLLDLPEAKDAKIIIHEARLNDVYTHTNIEKLAQSAPSDILAKTWLIHYSTKMSDKIQSRAKELGFAGACHQGQIIDVPNNMCATLIRSSITNNKQNS